MHGQVIDLLRLAVEDRKLREASALALGRTACNSNLDNVVLINVFCHE